MRDHLPHIGTCFMAVPSIRKPLFFRSSGPRINVHHWRLACFFGRARFDDQILWSGSKDLWNHHQWLELGELGTGKNQVCWSMNTLCAVLCRLQCHLRGWISKVDAATYIRMFIFASNILLSPCLCWFPCLGSCYPQSRSIGYHNVSIYIYICIIIIYIYTVYCIIIYSFRISLRQYRLKPAVVPFKKQQTSWMILVCPSPRNYQIHVLRLGIKIPIMRIAFMLVWWPYHIGKM